MIEAFRERLRKPEPASFEVPRSTSWDSEVRATAYLDTLDGVTRNKVENFIDFANLIQAQLGEVQIAVLAVGSSTRPDSARFHTVEDIDLRVLTSPDRSTEERKLAINKVRDSIREYLVEQGYLFQENDATIYDREEVPGKGPKDTTVTPLFPLLSDYNGDPSFTTLGERGGGLPLHISVSGLHNESLEKHLRLELASKTAAVLLVKPR